MSPVMVAVLATVGLVVLAALLIVGLVFDRIWALYLLLGLMVAAVAVLAVAFLITLWMWAL